METREIERKVKETLSKSETLTALLANGARSIYFPRAPSMGLAYPILVFKTISDVPKLHGDNVAFAHTIIIRVWSITKMLPSRRAINKDSEIDAAAREVMLDLGFMLDSTTPYVEKRKKMLISDYKISLRRDINKLKSEL